LPHNLVLNVSGNDMINVELEYVDNDIRYVPSGVCSFCGLAHESRYKWVNENLDIKDKIVLDFGCGVSYGQSLSQRHCR
jgi:hypothetical protein